MARIKIPSDHSENPQVQEIFEEINKVSQAKSTDKKIDFILKFVVQATKDPHKLTNNDFKKLRGFGYTDEDILEILAVMEMYTGYNKIISVLDIGIEE